MSENIEQNASNPNKNVNNTTNTFNLIIGIATLLIAILGATFAYFSATARSPENDVYVKSAYVSISYEGGTEIKAENLIPSTMNVALKKYQKEKYSLDEEGNTIIKPYTPPLDGEIVEDNNINEDLTDKKCIDAKGKEVCYVYQFAIESDGEEGGTTDIIASLKINKNQFENLSYVLYEVKFLEENGEILRDKYGFGIVDVENGGYQYIKSNFAFPDTNVDNAVFKDIYFDKFLKPFDLNKKDGELVGTLNPVVCLFGYENNNYQEEYETDYANRTEIAMGEVQSLSDNTARCKTMSIDNKIKHTYQLVIWLNETGKEQAEQGMTFEGTVAIEVSGGLNIGDYNNGQITGQD